MNIPTKEQRAEWRKLAEETMMVSAVGEYTPAEFTTLLDAVDALESAIGELLAQVDKRCGGRAEGNTELVSACNKARALLANVEDQRRPETT